MTRKHKRPESVLVVVYTYDGKVLLMRRSDYPEFWQSITGSLTWDETDPRDTAVRELAEETGIMDVAALEDLKMQHTYEIYPRWRYRYAPGITHNTEHVFALGLAIPVPVRLNALEHGEYRWLDFDEAISFASSYTNSDAIRMIRDKLRGAVNE